MTGSMRRHLSIPRLSGLVMICLGVITTACGTTGVTPSEYADKLNLAVGEATARADELTAGGFLSEDASPQEVATGLRYAVEEIRIPLQEAVDAIEPPEEFRDLHTLLWTWHADLIATETALAERLGTTPDTEAGWTELSESSEVAAYRASIAEGKQVCIDFQDELDSTEARGAFDGTAWIPSELGEVVRAALGCEFFPEDPSSIYRYP